MTELTNEQIIGLERRLLAALYQRPGLLGEDAYTRLRSYAWREPLHQVIFEALMSIPQRGGPNMETELAARLTRRGFPDVPWHELQRPCKISMRDFEELLGRLFEAMP